MRSNDALVLWNWTRYIQKDMFVEVGKGISPSFQQILELLLAKGEYLAFAPDTEETETMINLMSMKFPLLKVPTFPLGYACPSSHLHIIATPPYPLFKVYISFKQYLVEIHAHISVNYLFLFVAFYMKCFSFRTCFHGYLIDLHFQFLFP